MSRERVRRDLAQNIKCAAIRIKVTGLVMFMDAPTRHHTIVHAAADLMGRTLYTHEHEQGFLTATGRFIDRRRAALGAALRAADEPPASRQIMEALDDARAFVERHSEPWYLSGQQLLQQIDEAIAAEYERAAQPPDVLLGRRDP